MPQMFMIITDALKTDKLASGMYILCVNITVRACPLRPLPLLSLHHFLYYFILTDKLTVLQSQKPSGVN